MAPLTQPNQAQAVAADDDFSQYRAVSGLAVAGLLTGLFSILAFVHPLLCVVPVAAIVVNGMALRRIAEASPPLVGRKAALTGLALGLIFLAAAPMQKAIHDRDLHAQALQVAEEWFTALRDDRPEVAHRLGQFPTTAATRARPAVKDVQSGIVPLPLLRKYSQQSPVDLLLKLGRRAHVRLYANQDVWSEGEKEGVRDFYAVTVGQGPEAVSFFILLGATRTRELGTGDWQWQITNMEFVNRPAPEVMDALGG